MMDYDTLLEKYNYLLLENERLVQENESLRKEKSSSIDLMMKGEALRDRMMFDAIMNGAFSKKEKEDE